MASFIPMDLGTHPLMEKIYFRGCNLQFPKIKNRMLTSFKKRLVTFSAIQQRQKGMSNNEIQISISGIEGRYSVNKKVESCTAYSSKLCLATYVMHFFFKIMSFSKIYCKHFR